MTSREHEILKRAFLEELVYTGYEPVSPSAILGHRRFTQDSPVLPDVWIHYGLEPRRRHDLLLTPAFERSPGTLKNELRARLKANSERPGSGPTAASDSEQQIAR